jgi:photosystem II stability/assembly factor-like uncharacterized protein
MKRVFIVFCLLICIASAQGLWQSAGFTGSNIVCVAQHPQDTLCMLVAVADSLYHTSDGGYSWSLLTHFNQLPINYLTYDPIYCDTVYALLGNGSFSDGIYRSTDGGYNWNVLEWMLYPRDMAITNTSSGRIMLVGCDGPGVFKTEDDGNTWVVWNAGLIDSHVKAIDYCWRPDSQCACLAGTSQGLFYRLYTSPWIQASGIAVNVGVSSICFAKETNLGYATVGSGSWSDGVYRSTDNGYSWQVVDWWIYASDVIMNPLWQNYPNDTCGIFAGDSGLGVKYSSDCGTTWQEVNNGLGNLFVNLLSFHPQDSMRLFAATQGGLYRFQYGPGVAENTIDELNASALRLPTVQRAGLPINLLCKAEENVPLGVRVYDVAGRLKSFEMLSPGQSSLAPIWESGIYFVTLSEQGRSYKEKIIIFD